MDLVEGLEERVYDSCELVKQVGKYKFEFPVDEDERWDVIQRDFFATMQQKSDHNNSPKGMKTNHVPTQS